MAKFIKSASSFNDWLKDDVIEFCFIGRSNAGKSTLINSLANENIAKVSKTPGRTQLVNFFDFNYFRLIDLPGYGYAKVNDQKRFDIKRIIDEFLGLRKNLYGVFQIVDANVITEQDVEMSKSIKTRFVNHFVLLNKIDKQNISVYKNNLKKIAKYLDVDENKIVLISSKNKTNIKQIFTVINNLIKEVK